MLVLVSRGWEVGKIPQGFGFGNKSLLSVPN